PAAHRGHWRFPMQILRSRIALALLWSLMSSPCITLSPRGEDAKPGAEGDPAAAPKGEVAKYVFEESKVFPGTVRDYWIYVPRQYDPARPACLWVGQDGIQYNAPAVFDGR